jgi:SAM-dependent methyltransferase
VKGLIVERQDGNSIPDNSASDDKRVPLLVTEGEVAHYEKSAAVGANYRELSSHIAPLLKLDAPDRSFGSPMWPYLDAWFDVMAQEVAYRHIAPQACGRVMQLGGSGTHVVKMLVAGASAGVHVSPVPGECLMARSLAERFGVSDRLTTIVAVAEALPFDEGTFSAIYAGGCIHHTVTSVAFPEINRVLAANGRFAACEPWRGPVYELGIKIFGKRERGVNCRPMDSQRAAPMQTNFDQPVVALFGSLTRYPLLALAKLGIRLPARVLYAIARADAAVCRRSSTLRGRGSSVAMLGVKRPA